MGVIRFNDDNLRQFSVQFLSYNQFLDNQYLAFADFIYWKMSFLWWYGEQQNKKIYKTNSRDSVGQEDLEDWMVDQCGVVFCG